MQPETIGRYRILKELGRGAMGRVFLAHDPQIDREIAVKSLLFLDALPEGDREGARERFLREARAAGKLLHPGIVTLFDAGQAGDHFYLAMEYIRGDALDSFCREDALLPVETVVEMIASAAEALDYAHGEGIVHRDIKPANLMRVGETSVKVMDFGLARVRAAEAQRTQDGALFGTPSYMAPEQIRGLELDGRSDLFSLGVVLFELLTGEKPFPGDTVSSIIFRIVNEVPREASAVSGRVPAALDRFLTQAMAKERDDRFADGKTFAEALREAGRELAGSAGATAAAVVAGVPPAPADVDETGLPAPRRHARRKKKGSGGRIAVVLLLLVIAAGAAAYQFRDRLGLFLSDPPPPEDVWFETSVRAEPADLDVRLDGMPLDPALGGVVRYKGEEPYPVLSIESGCRTMEYTLAPGDSGGEVMLALDPAVLDWTLDPGLSAKVRVNGERQGETPLQLALDLCRDNEIVLEADGHHPATIALPAQASILQARNLLSDVALTAIPLGALVLPATDVKVVFYVDGKRIGSGTREVDLAEGEHVLRMKNDSYWIDVRSTVQVVGGEKASPAADLPPLTTLVVQAFPANCKVDLRVPRGKWRYLDDTPVRRKVAAGKYEVRVTRNSTGESQVREIELAPGKNPDIRVAFERDS